MSHPPTGRIESLSGWGMAHHAQSLVYRPTHPDQVGEALADARARGLSVTFRGAGISYGDAALNEGGAIVDLSGLAGPVRMADSGDALVAPAGATIQQAWQAALPHGFWVPVVPGTMKVTLGGATAANVHGKNHWARGTFGDQVRRLRMVDDSGDRWIEGEAVKQVVGGLGRSGAITEVELGLKPVASGWLDVTARSTRTLTETLHQMDQGARTHEYAVGWVDAFGGGRAGRGLLHFADDLPADHARAGKGMTPQAQALPSRIAGVLPRSFAPHLLKPWANDPGMRLLNQGRYLAGRMRNGSRYLQSHSAFHFLLDYVPGWKRIYAPWGLLQFQLFVPQVAAEAAFRAAFEAQARHGETSWLAVIKRHPAPRRPHDYWRDGFSMAMDFAVRPLRMPALRRLLADLEFIRREFGGGVYAAKDGGGHGVLPPGAAPDSAWSSNLTRRWASR